MLAEYDSIARQYRRSKDLPFRVYSEVPDHLQLLGKLSELSVLDVACGEGFYTRLIRQAGAARAVGVDVSSGMIELARQQEAQSPLGIEYICHSVEGMPQLKPFDIVSTAFLLNTAPNAAALVAMAASLAANLKPGGRLVATLGDLGSHPGVNYRPYGMATDFAAPLAEGAPYSITFLLGDDTFTITDFAWSRSTIENALSSAGFVSIRWRPPTITADGLARFGSEFWQTYLEYPPVIRVEGRLGRTR
ncbi:MAG TPA: class I SAM-dependent methyltransferase [Planctomycetaceae bacterium]|nr:class I SAM-dependent methyltransferase [Planctomycetaceae bacterium]